jgi:hypothetical protein
MNWFQEKHSFSDTLIKTLQAELSHSDPHRDQYSILKQRAQLDVVVKMFSSTFEPTLDIKRDIRFFETVIREYSPETDVPIHVPVTAGEIAHKTINWATFLYFASPILLIVLGGLFAISRFTVQTINYEYLHNTSIVPILQDIRQTISYVSDMDAHGQREFWQTPELTRSLGTGDCEDMALLLASMIVARTGHQPTIITGYSGNSGHAWVKFGNYYYESTNSTAVSLFNVSISSDGSV